MIYICYKSPVVILYPFSILTEILYENQIMFFTNVSALCEIF